MYCMCVNCGDFLIFQNIALMRVCFCLSIFKHRKNTYTQHHSKIRGIRFSKSCWNSNAKSIEMQSNKYIPLASRDREKNTNLKQWQCYKRMNMRRWSVSVHNSVKHALFLLSTRYSCRHWSMAVALNRMQTMNLRTDHVLQNKISLFSMYNTEFVVYQMLMIHIESTRRKKKNIYIFSSSETQQKRNEIYIIECMTITWNALNFWSVINYVILCC